MISKGEVPRVIDYQGARIGPPAYDIASVLWDPYYRLQEDMRERLVGYYIEKIRARLPDTFNEDAFRYSLLLCRLQRHMQALGAYGFLVEGEGEKILPQTYSRSAVISDRRNSPGKRRFPCPERTGHGTQHSL